MQNSATVAATKGTDEYTPVTSSASVCRIRRIQSIVSQTDNILLEEMERSVFEAAYPYIDPSSAANQGKPTIWYSSGYTTGTRRDLKFKLFRVPDASRTLNTIFYEEPLELVLGTDVPRIPDQWHYALAYLGIAKYFEYQKDFIGMYYRNLHEQAKAKVLNTEYDNTDEMPSMMPAMVSRAVVQGKIGRIYNR